MGAGGPRGRLGRGAMCKHAGAESEACIKVRAIVRLHFPLVGGSCSFQTVPSIGTYPTGPEGGRQIFFLLLNALKQYV